MGVPSLPNEIWRQIKTVTIKKQTREVKGEYYVSNLGRVKNRSRLMSQAAVKDGYMTCNIDRERILVHRLVAQEFVDNQNPDINTVIDHIDGIKTNNKADNLRWVTQQQNSQFAVKDPKSKVERIHSDILAIDKENNATLYNSQKEAAEATEADPKAVNKVLKGQFKATKGFRFFRINTFTDRREKKYE